MRHYKASLPFILITVFVDVLGIGLMLPVLPTPTRFRFLKTW